MAIPGHFFQADPLFEDRYDFILLNRALFRIAKFYQGTAPCFRYGQARPKILRKRVRRFYYSYLSASMGSKFAAFLAG